MSKPPCQWYAGRSCFSADEPLRSAYATDARAYAVGGGILAAAAAATQLDRGRPLPQNAALNVQLRAQHARKLAEAEAENRRRISEYRVTLRFAAEGTP